MNCWKLWAVASFRDVNVRTVSVIRESQPGKDARGSIPDGQTIVRNFVTLWQVVIVSFVSEL